MSKVVTRPYELALLRGAFDPKSAREVFRVANAKLFGDEDSLKAFRAFQRLHCDRIPVTKDNIILELQATEAMGPESAVVLVEEVLALPLPTAITRLATGLGKLRERSLLKELREALADPEHEGDVEFAVKSINEFTASAHVVSAKAPETLTETMARMLERKDPVKVYKPGLGLLDNYWKIRKGAYGVIGADSGGGKTSMMINIAVNVARQGAHVGIISIEMTADELTFRASAMEAGVDAGRIEDAELTQFELDHIASVAAMNKDIYDRIHILDPATVQAEELPGYYNELITQYGCEVIFIDYIQRINVRQKTSGKTESVAIVSETITAVTKSTGVATIALSVLNETQSAFSSTGGGKQKRKGLSNLKHSHQIGHDAHWVVIMTAEDWNDEDVDKKIIVETVKNRKGQSFVKVVNLHGPTQRITYLGSLQYEEATPVPVRA